MTTPISRIDEVVEFIRNHDTADVLATMLPELAGHDWDEISTYCRFTHAAVLVFGHSLPEVQRDLREYGLLVGEITPSVVVRDRLSRRYGLPRRALDVGILRAPVDGEHREIEIFALAVPPGAEDIAADERANGHETHVALEVTAPDGVILSGLRAMLTERGRLRSDGGGYNGHEDTTVLY